MPYQWRQWYPFNLYTPTCDCAQCNSTQRKGHRPIGCVAVALAQAFATIGVFPGTFFGNANIRFSELPKWGSSMNGGIQFTVAQFLHEIALGCQTKFGCDISLAYLKAAWYYLTDLGYNGLYQEGALVPGRVYTELKNGMPHIIGAYASSLKKGHTWLIDGVVIENSKFQYHFNWGWNGDSDGWSYGEVFQSKDDEDNESPKFDKDFSHIYLISKPK